MKHLKLIWNVRVPMQRFQMHKTPGVWIGIVYAYKNVLHNLEPLATTFNSKIINSRYRHGCLHSQ